MMKRVYQSAARALCALALTVATLALLAPVAHANPTGSPLDGKIWQSDYGQTQFTYQGTYDFLGDTYDYYTGHLTYTDRTTANLWAYYWVDYRQLTFSYQRDGDQGHGVLNYSYSHPERSDRVNFIDYLDGTWTSTKYWYGNNSGTWHLWRNYGAM